MDKNYSEALEVTQALIQKSTVMSFHSSSSVLQKRRLPNAFDARGNPFSFFTISIPIASNSGCDAEYLSLSSRLKSALGSLLKHNVLKTPEIVHTS
uniref:Uncharacterized protein n=1 Tax=Oryza punctata TaxID=4537 RepID=A0A0E0JQ07_ORYPU